MTDHVEIAVTKAKAAITFTKEEIDALPDEVFSEIVKLGLKEMVNRGMSKIGAAKGLEGEALQKYEASAMEIAKANVEKIKSGEILKGRKSGSLKVSGAVKTEAMRLARNLVKDELKKAGLKISHYPASEITNAAKALLEVTPEIIAQAEANLASRAQAPAKIDVTKLVKESPDLVAKAEKAKAERKTQLSAKQAGLPKKHKPAAEASVH
jgi:hypothetical protein